MLLKYRQIDMTPVSFLFPCEREIDFAWKQDAKAVH